MSIVQITFLASLLVATATAQTPLGTAFTYQGRLNDAGSPASGTYDLRFVLYDSLVGGAPQGSPDCADNISVIDGLFTLDLDFGAQFTGQERFLEIEVRADTGLNCGNATGFVTLGPRQALSGTPNALFSLNAGKLDGLDSSAFLQSIPVPLNLTGSAYNIIGATNTSTDNASVGVYGASTAASGATYGVWGQSGSVDGVGVRGQASSLTGATTGVLGYVQSTDGRAVHGWANSGTGNTYGGYFQSQSTSGVGAFGYATASSGSTYGLFGQSDSTSGRGVYGLASTATGNTSGVYGRADSTAGKGVYGTATAASGLAYGVHGASASTSGVGTIGHANATSGTTYGVYGQSDSSTGVGVYGITTYTGVNVTYGGSFRSNSQQGRGVYGRAASGSGVTYGGYFETDSDQGTGVYGAGGVVGVQGWSDSEVGVLGQAGSSGTGGVGGSFESLSTDGRGVVGWASGGGSSYGGSFGTPSTSGRGVYGSATAATGGTFGGYFESSSTSGYGVYARNNATSGTIYGVRGYASTAASGYAVYAAGDMGASGVKPFRIDHPIDPEHKYLLHYATESPEVLNAYSGKVILDEHGTAVVELPVYFASINKDPRYTLTAIGTAMPNLHVADEISETALTAGEQAGPGEAPPTCSFRIAGGLPQGKVSWRVEAVRNDLRMRLHGAPVEREKSGLERGKYQHPEYYGLPSEMGMDDHGERDYQEPAVSPSVTPD